MKILVAIESTKRSMEMAHTTLRWAARAGFNLRIFIPDLRQFKKYWEAVDDANYHYYFDIPMSVIIPKSKFGTPMEYAKREGYDLLLYLPDNMLDWETVEDDDKTFVEYAADVAKARVSFGKQPHLQQIDFDNGAKMVRVE